MQEVFGYLSAGALLDRSPLHPVDQQKQRFCAAKMFSEFKSVLANPRQSLQQVLNFALVLSTAFMLWKSLSVISNSPSPIVVVLSGSMEPAFQRGDLLFLWNRDVGAEVGEIVVYNVKGKDIPIVHRVVRKHVTMPISGIEASAK